MFNRRLRRKIRIGAHSATDNRPKIITAAIICTVALAEIITLTVLLGNHLKRQAENVDSLIPSDSSSTAGGTNDSSEPVAQYDASAVPVIQAEYVTLSSSVGINWSERAQDLKQNGTTAVSLILYYGDSVVNYSSRVAQEMSYQGAQSGKTELSEAIGVLSTSGIYSAGCFYATFHQKLYPDIISIYRAYEAALIAEAVDAQFSEVTVFGFGCDENGYIYAGQLFDAARELDPEATLGVALPADVVELAERQLLFSSYATVADYLALDLSSYTTADSLRAVLADALTLINKYNVRIIVSSTLDGAEDVLAEAGIINWQKVPD